jgi:ribosomal protein L3 glutamine methyltransferase
VAAFPLEYQAEPQLAHLGGADGLDIVRRILHSAADHLTADGSLLVEIGTGQERLEGSFPDLPFFWLDTARSGGEVFGLSASDLRHLARQPDSRDGERRHHHPVAD